jgi:tetratricopeptide (TPR) repeat protein
LVVGSVTVAQRSAVRDALKANDWDAALDLAEDLVDDHPNSSVAHFLLASALRVKMQEVSQVRAMFSLGDYKEALAKSIELDPKNVDARTEEIGFYLFAPGIAGGDQDHAIERIKQLKAVSLYHGLQMEAQLAAVNEQPDQQGQLLQRMVELEPDNPVGLMQLAGWHMQREAHTEAEALLLRINGIEDPGWPLLAQYQRAKWRILAQQESALAIELLQGYREKLPQVDSELGLPPTAAAWWREALAHENQGNTQQAIESLKRSLAADKDFAPAEKDLDRLTD